MKKILNIFLNILNLFNSLSVVQKSLVVSILSVVLFTMSVGISYSVFSSVGGVDVRNPLVSAKPGPSTVVTEDPDEPRTEECPLNGQMFTKATKERWENRWPLAVMIENHKESRPQSGLSSANIVYEAVAEGGITRFMALYLCNPGDVQVGPVRSARTYFLDWLGEYDALYGHVGGANCDKETGSGCANGAKADALGQIIKYKVKDMNQMYYCCGYPTYWRDYTRLSNVVTEHTMYSAIEKLWTKGVNMWLGPGDLSYIDWKRNFTAWKFKDDGSSKDTVSVLAAKIDVEFWSGRGDYGVSWEYDGTCNCYKRSNGGQPHMDLNNNQQLSVKNIVIQFQKEANANDGYPGNVHLLYGTIGSGKAYFFQDGKMFEGKWIKKSRTARTQYVDDKGKEIAFTRGLIWIQTVPEGAKVAY